MKFFKKFNLENDYDAFVWLRSHSETPECAGVSSALSAKAFDLALQKLRVTHLDRRIFWSELDEEASGGICFEEFEGKLTFPLDEEESDSTSKRPMSCLKK